MQTQIRRVHGREVLDSRGNPTVEAEVTLADGTVGRGMAPSGASTGAFEAMELRDGETTRYGGRGALTAVRNINTRIAERLIGLNAADLHAVDQAMIYGDGTRNKSAYGANAILAVSLATADAAAKSLNLPLYRFLGGQAATGLPLPMMNILNGGAHASNSLDIQEFMIVPIGAKSWKEGLRWCTEVYQSLKKLLTEDGFGIAVGDEGGFAPDLSGEKAVLEYLLLAIRVAGYEAGSDFALALDAAASEWKKKEGGYELPKSGKRYTTEELVTYWKQMVAAYPIYSIEDPLAEEDWEGWKKLTEEIGNRVMLVGDDLFVTNAKRLKRGIREGCANAILIKPNQIGTISETLEAVKMAKANGYAVIASHRSGETEDTAISDLAVAWGMGYLKAGAPCRTERVAKYNRLLRIEEELGKSARFATKIY